MPTGLQRRYGHRHLHFITCSCYRRLPLLRSVRARNLFFDILREVRLRYQFALVGLVVMPEHFHLLISEPKVGTPSRVLQVLKQRVSRKLRQRRLKRVPSSQLRLWKESSNPGLLATPLLRLQRLEPEEENREAQLHAHESRQTRPGRPPQRLALE